MDDSSRSARLLLESATALAQACNARAIVAPIDGLPGVDTVPPRTILVRRDDDGNEGDAPIKGAATVITTPAVELDRMGSVKLAAIIALSSRLIDISDTVVFLAGPQRSTVDTMVVLRIGDEFRLFDPADDSSAEGHVRRAVFHRVLTIALQLGQHGRESRKIGTLLVVGDHERVLEQAEQMILNPFKGYSDAERNILDDAMRETVKEFSSLDGAFIIRGDGVIETAGARLKTGISKGLPSGLGARHAAAAAITASTRAIAITVSESDGTVRVWHGGGDAIASFEPSRR